MRSTIAGGLTYVSLPRISCGFHPCCATLVCAPSGRATTTARPATKRHGGDERVIACSGGERDFWGEASTIDIRWLDGARCGETVADNLPSGGLGRRKWHDASGVVLMTPSPPVQR